MRRWVMVLWSANLDVIRPMLLRCYSGHGRPPRDPAAMFRTWLLATLMEQTSPKEWAERLRSDSLVAVLCGFDPADTPGASTLRDFMSRLTRQMRRRAAVHRPHRARGKGPGKGQKRPLRRPDVLWRLAVSLPRFSHGDEGPLQEMLAAIAHGSAARGLLDFDNLAVAGDSTVLSSHTSHFGRRTCSCPRHAACHHPRKFADPDATWGWDSSPGEWVYGHRFYEITAAGSPHDLPLYIRNVGADRHDGVSWLLSYAAMRTYYADAHLVRAILDSAHDAGAIFDQLETDQVQAVIDLNPAHHRKSPVTLNPEGLPLCACGEPMAPDGSSRGRLKFVCPRMRRRRHPDSKPPCPAAVYIAGEMAFRLHPGLARGTDTWRLAYNSRTCTERSHNRKLHQFAQEDCRRRGRAARTAHYFFAAYAQHFAAWALHPNLRIETVFRDLLQPYMAKLRNLP